MNTNNNKGLLELVFGIFDRLTSTTDIKSRIYNVIVMLIIFFMIFTVYQWDDLKKFIIEAKYDTYREAILMERESKFESIVQQQVQILHINSKSDLTLVYEYYPPNQQLFFNALFYEGKLPGGAKDIAGFQAIPINKTSTEYKVHVGGDIFKSYTEFNFFPYELSKELKYIFSCPIFNLDNVYAGNISMLWYEDVYFDDERLDALDYMCNQSARFLGRAK